MVFVRNRLRHRVAERLHHSLVGGEPSRSECREGDEGDVSRGRIKRLPLFPLARDEQPEQPEKEADEGDVGKPFPSLWVRCCHCSVPRWTTTSTLLELDVVAQFGADLIGRLVADAA